MDMSILNELQRPITKVYDSDNYGIYVDFPLDYDIYNRQKILTGLKAAIPFIFNSFYGDYRLLPQVQGLYIDILRYKNILDSEVVIQKVKNRVNTALQGVLTDLNPSIDIEFDAINQKMVYQIHLEGNVTLEVENAEDLLNAEITINKKKFYE